MTGKALNTDHETVVRKAGRVWNHVVCLPPFIPKADLIVGSTHSRAGRTPGKGDEGPWSWDKLG